MKNASRAVRTGTIAPLRRSNPVGNRLCGVGAVPGVGGCSTSSCVAASSTTSSTRCSSLIPARAPAKPAPPLRVRPRRAYASGSLRPAAAGHREAELLFRRGRRELADDPPLVDDEDPVGERQDLPQAERDEEHGAARIALLDEPAVDELDRADVEPACRLGRD